MMWSRSELKSQAKTVLQGRYWTAFLVCLFVGGIGSAGATLTSFIPFAPLAVSLFITPPLIVGQSRWFSRGREAAAVPAFDQVFSLFRGGSWGPTVGAMLWMYLFLFLWSLLAVFPLAVFVPLLVAARVFRRPLDHPWPESLAGDHVGAALILVVVFLALLLAIPAFVKMYSYRMVPWILADNPRIGYDRALKLSMALTQGQRWNIFVLDLSFLGWFILGLLACGIGTLFVMPYYWAVYAELYARLRHSGVERALCTMEELGFIPANHYLG
ncbi:MAG: DUF975 family protein [Saccharofermentanales bacterium]|jgi:uncharacterized membrane protein